MKPRLLLAFPLLLAACTPPAPPKAKVTMSITVGVSENRETGKVKINGQPKGDTPLELDVLTLAFDPALKPKSWPPPGATEFPPTVAQHGKEESSLTLAMDGDVLFVRTVLHGTETTGAIRLTVAAADGTSLEFDVAEKSLASGLGHAEHGVRLWYKKRK